MEETKDGPIHYEKSKISGAEEIENDANQN